MIKEFQGEYRFLSNFWPCRVWLDGDEYKSVEHAYQAAKTLDKEQRQFIREAASPGQAKRRGNTVRIRKDWESVKLVIMSDLVEQKFIYNSILKSQLLSTGDKLLQEGNRWGDTYWGVDLRTGQGSNHLGKILMRIRNKLSL